MEEKMSPDPVSPDLPAQETLRARAALLARPPDDEGAGGECLEIVEFLLSGERYGIESSYVGEVCPLKSYEPLPCTPRFVLGIMNLRGKIVSIVDIGTFFDLPDRGLSDRNTVIVLQGGALEFGVLADVILGTRTIPVHALHPSLPTLTDIRADYLKGVTAERLVVLDGEKIISDSRIVVHEEVC